MPGGLRRVAVLLGVLLVAFLVSLGMASPAQAEQINDFKVAVTVNPDTTFTVTETIVYDFLDAERHGIFRDIPITDETTDGRFRSYGIRVDSVTMDGASIPYEESDESSFRHLKIGDPNTTITGAHTYVITYTVSNGMRSVSQSDVADPQAPAGISVGDVELYWDLVGTGWEVPITSAVGSVVGPAPAIAAKCFSGAFGDTSQCAATVQGSTTSIGPVSLPSGAGLTASIVYPRGAFTEAPTENITDSRPSSGGSTLLGLGAGATAGVLLVAVPTTIAIARRRRDAGAPVPGAPPQYSPPDGLSPAELDAAWQGTRGTTQSRVLLATLLDLAQRRWINVSDDGGDLRIDWLGTGTSPLRPWEEAVMAPVMKGQPSAELSGYDSELASVWGAQVRELVQQQEATGRRNARGDAPDKRWNWLMLVTIITIPLALICTFIGWGAVSAFGFAVGFGSLIGFVIARAITPRSQTEQSAQFIAKVEGFRKVLGTDAAAGRREFAQRSGLAPEAIFATMLPYAVLFELEYAWLGAFPDLTPEQLHSYGFYVPNMVAMSSFVDSGTSSMSSAMTAPSSGSGGGGFSGGGGGGGGGGSW